jgi:hypothetical protein
MLVGAEHDGLISLVVVSLYVNDVSTHYHHVKLSRHGAEDTTLVARFRRSSLLVRHLETCLGRLDHWLRDWGIANNVSKRTAVLYAKMQSASRSPGQSSFFGESIQWA